MAEKLGRDGMSDTERAFFGRYARIYNPEANDAATEEMRRAVERRAELRKLYPPDTPPRGRW
jgi:hypothetical protein